MIGNRPNAGVRTESVPRPWAFRPAVAFILIASLLLRLAAPVAVAAAASPSDPALLQVGLGELASVLCRNSGSSRPEGWPDTPAPRRDGTHDCLACCAPIGLDRIPPAAIDAPVRTEHNCDTLIAPACVGVARSVHVVRQRGPPRPPSFPL